MKEFKRNILVGLQAFLILFAISACIDLATGMPLSQIAWKVTFNTTSTMAGFVVLGFAFGYDRGSKEAICGSV